MLGIQLVEKPCDLLPGGPAERDRHRQVFCPGRCDEQVKCMAPCHPVDRPGKVFEGLELLPVPGAPPQVLVAEVIDGTHFIPCTICRLCDVACRKAGDQDPPLHRSSVCFPAFDGTMRICAPGNSFRSSSPEKRWSRKSARLEISEWGWAVTATL